MKVNRKRMAKARDERRKAEAWLRTWQCGGTVGAYHLCRRGFWWYVFRTGRRGYLIPVSEGLPTRSEAVRVATDGGRTK